jgi:hypothetical protein
MFDRPAKSGDKPAPDLRSFWLVTMVGLAAVILLGAFALIIPSDFVQPVLAVGVLIVPAFCIWLMFLCSGDK